MPKYIGFRNGKIYIVSDTNFNDKNSQTLLLPSELEGLTSDKLMLDYTVKNGKVLHKNDGRKAKELKIAFVSNYAMECGIALYGESLYSEIINHIGDYKLFIEKNENPIHPFDLINGKNIPKDKVVQCWKRGESLQQLVQEIKAYDPDLILINHEPGLFPNSRYWISMMTQLSGYRVITTMHSVYRHQDKTIVEATMPEIIVHLDGAKNVLVNEKKLSAKIYVIPHGTIPSNKEPPLWNFYKTNYTFMQQGFLFRYKGFTNSIEATRILKDKYIDIYFTGLCSESPMARQEHETYYNELLELVRKYGLEDNVGLIRGYQSDTVLSSFLRMNKAAVFPYVSNKEHECFGSSGAAPYAMSKEIPIITSNIHHFSGLPSIRAENPQQIAEALDQLFTDEQLRSAQIERQNQYLIDNSWENVALKYLAIMQN